MLDDALRKLQLDRRLLDRRGWITRDARERALAELPDVADKAAPAEPVEREEAGPEAGSSA
jgi:hypothetical protein